jgi:hypothetical protein
VERCSGASSTFRPRLFHHHIISPSNLIAGNLEVAVPDNIARRLQHTRAGVHVFPC